MAREPQRLSRVTCFVLAGGDGRRLHPLTATLPKPLLPFAGVHRLLDFTLSNLANSRLCDAYVLTQHLAGDIGKYLSCRWGPSSGSPTRFMHHPSSERKRYTGTADAILQNLQHARIGDLILVLSADHVYRMDYRPLLDWHARSGARATVAALPVPLESAREFGILAVDSPGGAGRITAFVEKPQGALAADSNRMVQASMGVYVFDLWTLWRALSELQQSKSALDFGHDVIPWFVSRGEATACPAGRLGSDQPFYWRDVGTVDAYYKSSMDLISGTLRPESLPEERAHRGVDPATVESGSLLPDSEPWNGSVVASRIPLGKCAIERSIVGPGVTIGDGTDVRSSILLPGARIGHGASVRNAIIDSCGEVSAGDEIGYRPARDRERFLVTGEGIAVVSARRRERVWAASAPRSITGAGRRTATERPRDE